MKLGMFEAQLMRAIYELGPDRAYGIAIGAAVEGFGVPKPSVGALYTTLERLGGKGFISSKKGSPLAEPGGRAKTYYKIEGAGAEAYTEFQAACAGFLPVRGQASS